MKNPIKARWFWFIAGLLFLPAISFLLGLGSAPDVKRLMPFTALREETTSEFYFPGDYTYTLRSKVSREEFESFVRTMKMHEHRSSVDHYKKEDGDLTVEIFYQDGWINFRKIQT